MVNNQDNTFVVASSTHDWGEFADSVSSISFGDAMIVLVPVGLLVWSAKLAINYYKDNSARDTELEDKYDSELYAGAVVPLYKCLNTLLATTVVFDTNIEKYEEDKHAVLQENDYSQVSGVVGFTEAIEGILSTQKNKKKLRRTRMWSRWLIAAVPFMSVVSLCGAVSYYLLPQGIFGLIGFFVNISMMILAILCTLGFYVLGLTLDAIQNEKR